MATIDLATGVILIAWFTCLALLGIGEWRERRRERQRQADEAASRGQYGRHGH